MSELENQNDMQEEKIEAAADSSSEEKRYSQEDAEQIIKKRLRQERDRADKEAAELKAKIAELENKIKEGTATTSEKIEHQEIKNTAKEAVNAGISPAELPHILKAHQEQVSFNQKISDALEKDPEFKKLSTEGNFIDPAIITAMHHLDNAPAVLKLLLKDKKEHHLMNLNAQEGLVAFTRYINDLSTRLEEKSAKPRPPSFKAAPNLQNTGDSDQDWSEAEYIKNNPRF